MPLLFSYGSLQQEEVQRSTLGRVLEGWPDELLRHESALVLIEDPRVAEEVGKTHHANVFPSEREGCRVPGMVFEVTEAELAGIDVYEAAFAYERVVGALSSGREAWVYVHGPSLKEDRSG